MIIDVNNWVRDRLDASGDVSNTVKNIIADVELNKEQSIDQYSLKFDRFLPQTIDLLPFDEYPLNDELKQSIKFAANRIQRFAKFQCPKTLNNKFSDEFGVYGETISPLTTIGAYIPGGKSPLVSTALMTLIPAKVAGCRHRIACSPSKHPALLAAASLAGATQFLQLGGVQAMCSLALGYKTIPAVDLLVGPGNIWVNEAKKQLQHKVKIDGLAGPSELLALCDKDQPIVWLAYDALAQSEHDPLACSIIISDDIAWLSKLDSFLKNNEEFSPLLNNNQLQLVCAESVQEMIKFSEKYAPEHLMLCHKKISPQQLKQYGSLFIGSNSAVALGDYISGPNHTLPTSSNAKNSGGLSVNTFLKRSTYQQLNDYGRKILSLKAIPIASTEGLSFHRQSMQIRVN